MSSDEQNTEMIADEDPLLISQSLTYVTDDGGILHSFRSARLSTGELLLTCSVHDKLMQRLVCFRVQNTSVHY